jgi:SAM-dependent methyltransferase
MDPRRETGRVAMSPRLCLYPVDEYPAVGRDDPIRHYAKPIFGPLYRRRVEACLEELHGGGDILEVGFGSGVAFPNLSAMYERLAGLDLEADAARVGDFWQRKGIAANLKTGSVLAVPFPDGSFDAVLLISILEHLRPAELGRAFREVARVLRPGGQAVYGVPIDRRLTRWAFRLLGYDIRRHHFSTDREVRRAAEAVLHPIRYLNLIGPFGIPVAVYQVGSLARP